LRRFNIIGQMKILPTTCLCLSAVTCPVVKVSRRSPLRAPPPFDWFMHTQHGSHNPHSTNFKLFIRAGSRVPFGQRLGWQRCTVSQLVYSCHVLQSLVVIVYYYIFYRFIVKRLRPLFVGGAIQIAFDWLIDWTQLVKPDEYAAPNRSISYADFPNFFCGRGSSLPDLSHEKGIPLHTWPFGTFTVSLFFGIQTLWWPLPPYN